jgi:hypothetical protein
MAVDAAPKLTRKRIVAAKIETTTGTTETLAAADATTVIFDPSMEYETEFIERDAQGGSISPIKGALGARSGRCSLSWELYGSGSGTAPSWYKFLRAAGFTLNTLALAPNSAATETLTIGMYRDGLLKQLAGCMGNITISIRNGQRVMCRGDFMGVPYSVPSDTAILAPTYDTATVPRAGATTFTVGGSTYQIESVEIDVGNEVMLRPDITAVDAAGAATGFRAAMIVNRRVTVRLGVEAKALATVNWTSLFHAGTTSALSCVIGSGSNGVITIAAPKLQLISPPTDGDRNGILTHELEFVAIRDADAGNDELTIAQT